MISAEAPLFNIDPTAYLPHLNPFLFVDRIIALESGSRASGLKTVTNDPAGFPVFFLLEAIAQVAGIAAAQQEGEGGFLAAVEHAEFCGMVSAGDSIVVTARIIKSFGNLHLCEGEATVDGKRVAAATLTLGIGKL